MDEYIKRSEAIESFDNPAVERYYGDVEPESVIRVIERIPAADVVSRGAYDQTDWERCVALTQLKEIGKGLGERMDDVRPVVLCRDCRHNKGAKVWRFLDLEDTTADCSAGHGYPPIHWFCADGEKREES